MFNFAFYRTFEIVADTCTEPFVECYNVYLGPFSGYTTQCRRGFYRYSCYYIVRRYVNEDSTPSPQPNVTDFKSFIQEQIAPTIIKTIRSQITAENNQQSIKPPQHVGPTESDYDFIRRRLRCWEAIARKFFHWYTPEECHDPYVVQPIQRFAAAPAINTQRTVDPKIYFPSN